jgi:plastocyanin
MKRHRTSLGIVTAAILASSSVLLAHEECDEVPEVKTSSGERRAATISQSSTGANVTIKLFQYQPGRLQVRAGTTVTWLNEDDIFHSITADKKDGRFDAPLDGKGKSFSFTFTKPGIYSYYCDRHEHMRGEIEVR